MLSLGVLLLTITHSLFRWAQPQNLTPLLQDIVTEEQYQPISLLMEMEQGEKPKCLKNTTCCLHLGSRCWPLPIKQSLMSEPFPITA